MASLRKKGRMFYVRVSVGGEQRDIATKTDDLRLARAIQKQIEHDMAARRFSLPTSTDTIAVIESFAETLRFSQRSKSYSTDLSRLRCLFGPICPCLQRDSRGAKPVGSTKSATSLAVRHLEDLDRETIRRALMDLFKSGRSVTTVNGYREILRRLYSHAIERFNFTSRDLKFPNPIDGIGRFEAPPKAIGYMSPDEVAEQMRVLAGRPDLRAAVSMMLFGGMRREEVLWTTWADVDLERREVRVTPKTNPQTGEYWAGKTRGSVRNFPANATLLDELTRWRDANKRASVKDWVVPAPRGGWWHPDNFSADLRDFNAGHGLRWSALDFRHTFASHNLQAGADPTYLARYMGTSVQMIFKHYGTLIGATNRAAVDGVSESFLAASVPRSQTLEVMDQPKQTDADRIAEVLRAARRPLTVSDLCSILNLRPNHLNAVLSASRARFERLGKPKEAKWALRSLAS